MKLNMNGNSSTLSKILKLNANNIYESICDNIPILSLGSTSNKILTKLKWSLDNVTYIDNTLEIQEEQIIGVNFYGNKVFLTNGIYELLDDLSLGDKLNENIPSELKKSNNKSLIPINDKYYGIRDGINVSIYSFDEQSNELVLIETIEIQNINAIFGSGYQHNLFSSSYIYVFNTGDTLIGYNINGQNVYLNQSRNITTDKILSGYTSYAQDGSPISGTMTNNGELNITPSTQEQTIPEGYTSGGTINAVDNTIDSNIQATNIKKDIVILGVTGTYEGDNINDYFNTITSDDGTSFANTTIASCIKKLPPLDTSNTANMQYMFRDCNKLINIPKMNTSNVTNMNGMFDGCQKIETIPDMDTSKVTDMYSMFINCNSLVSIPEINTQNVTSMGYMFAYCNNLTSIPDMDTSKVTDMSNMFFFCDNLTTIPILNMNSVTYLENMFMGCTLTEASLNNILESLLTATVYTGTKTLQYIGLTQEQAQICTTLSNWTACQELGWTTGYETT